MRDEGARHPHAEVDAKTEERGGGDLPKLEGLEGAAQNEELAKDKKEIHTEGERAVGKGSNGREDPGDG